MEAMSSAGAEQAMYSANYHTHNHRCKHAAGNVSDYCEKAVKSGLSVLGISDHAPYPDRRWSKERMLLEEFPDYCREIDKAKSDYPSLTVFKAAECEFVPEYLHFFEDYFLGEQQLDYILLGNHYVFVNEEWHSIFHPEVTPAVLHRYTDAVLQAMGTGLYSFIAHPDVFGVQYLTWDSECIACSRTILEAAEDTHIPLEFNTYGLRKKKIDTPSGMRAPYPLNKFWELAAAYNIDVLVNSDAHRPEDVCKDCQENADRLTSLGFHVVNQNFHQKISGRKH